MITKRPGRVRRRSPNPPMSSATAAGCCACRSWSPPGNSTSSACVSAATALAICSRLRGGVASPVAASSSTGQRTSAYSVRGRCRSMLPTIARCRSRSNHGVRVPSGRSRRLPIAASIAASGQSGCPARSRRRRVGASTSSNRGGASTLQAASRVGHWSPRCSQPPSTSARACTRSGRSAASWSTTFAPHDWPATTGAAQPSPAHTAARSRAAECVGSVAGVSPSSPSSLSVSGTVADEACPRRSTATTGCPAEARRAATPSHSRALDDSPCTSSTGRAPPPVQDRAPRATGPASTVDQFGGVHDR